MEVFFLTCDKSFPKKNFFFLLVIGPTQLYFLLVPMMIDQASQRLKTDSFEKVCDHSVYWMKPFHLYEHFDNLISILTICLPHGLD